MKCKLCVISACIAMFIFSMPTHAVDEEFVYRIGGGGPLGGAVTIEDDMDKLTVGTPWNLDLHCGNFDIEKSISNQLNGLSGYFDKVMNQVINAATAYVSNLPAMVIQRLNPALYDLLQNGINGATGEFNFTKANCQQIASNMSREVAEDGWRGLAKAEVFSEEANKDGADILQSEEKSETEGGDKGVTWIDGEHAGGEDQPPIKVNGDVSVAGYNMLLKRNVVDKTEVSESECGGSDICEAWDKPEDAAAWLTDVIGEREIRTCTDCEKMKGTAGKGLHNKYESEHEEVAFKMSELVYEAKFINEDTLSELLGASGLPITRTVIEAIRGEDQRDLVISRLSGEIALATTMNRALAARRMLLAGAKEPNVANNEIAQEDIRNSSNELHQEIESVMFELEVREKMVSYTAQKLLQRQDVRNMAPIVEVPAAHNFEDGAVK